MLKKPAGRSKSVRTPENIVAVRTSIEQSPSRSARKYTSALGISDQTVRQILHCDLKLHPYKITLTQELSLVDWGKRKDCCNAILTIMSSKGIVWSSDEAHFYISGTVNKQNFRYWVTKNLQIIHQ